MGFIYKFDLSTRRCVSNYIGSKGSVRSVNCHPTLPFIASTGLDQYVRIFNINNRMDYQNIYVKQKTNCVLFSSDTEIETEEKKETEDDKLWKKLENNSKKRKRSE